MEETFAAKESILALKEVLGKAYTDDREFQEYLCGTLTSRTGNNNLGKLCLKLLHKGA